MRVIVLSAMAGAFISLGGILSLYLGYGFSDIAHNPSLQRLLSALAFPVGLFLIVMFGGELFTGNNAVLIPGLNKGKFGLRDVIGNWATVWTGNFIGALLFTVFLVYGAGLVDIAPYDDAIKRIATAKTELSPLKIFLRGIGANWCVCLAVWLSLAASNIVEKTIVVWIPVAAFVALGFEHCIANMFFIPCGILAGAEIPALSVAKNLLYSTAGNIIGGAVFVGMLYNRLYTKK